MDDQDRNAPATKGDIADLRRATKDDIADLRRPTKDDLVDVHREIKEIEERLVEAFRDGQTELLKVFYNFAESNKRIAQNEVNEVANRSRIETLERVTELEQRLITPPAA